MKRKFILASILGLSSFALLAQESTYTNIYFNKELTTDYSPWSNDYYLENSSSWNVGSPDGNLLTGSPNNSNYNLFISGTSQRKGGSYLVSGYSIANWNVHDITYQLTSDTFFSFSIPNNRSFNIGGDYNVEMDVKSWGSGSFRTALENTATMYIAGDLYIKNTSVLGESGSLYNNGVEFFVEHSNTGAYSTSFVLAGDVIMSDNGIFTYKKGWSRENYFNSRIKLSFSVAYSEIGGTINMVEANEGDRVIDLFRNDVSSDELFSTATRKFGGINGTGSILMGASSGKDVALIFTNSKSQSWKGALAGGTTAHKLNIIMDATNASAKQAMHIIEEHMGTLKDGDSNAEYYENIAVASVLVENGTFEFGSYDGLKNGSLTIAGNKAKFLVGGAEVEALGNVNFTSASISAGTLGVAFNQNVTGALTISADDSVAEDTGSFYVADPSAFTITLDYIAVEDSVLTEQIADFGGEMDLGTIISFEDTNLTSDNITSGIIVKVVDEAGNVIDGVEATLNAVFGDNDKITGIGAVVSLIAVPEPATFAALFGAFALLFVAYRKRR